MYVYKHKFKYKYANIQKCIYIFLNEYAKIHNTYIYTQNKYINKNINVYISIYLSILSNQIYSILFYLSI